MKTYKLIGPGTEADINVQDGDMIVYDVCKIKDYEGGDYVPRKAKDMDHHALHEMFNCSNRADEEWDRLQAREVDNGE